MRFLSVFMYGGLILFLPFLLNASYPNDRAEAIGGDDFRIGKTQFSRTENVTIRQNYRYGGTVCTDILYDTSYHNFQNAKFFGGDNYADVAYRLLLSPIIIIMSSNHYQGTLTRSLQKMVPKFSFVSERRTTAQFTTSDPGIGGFMACLRFDYDYSYRSADSIRRGITIPAGMSLDWLSIERELFPNSLAKQIHLPAKGTYSGFSCESHTFNGKIFANPIVLYSLYPTDVWNQKKDYFDVAWLESITSDSLYACVESPPILQNIEKAFYKFNFFAFDNNSVTSEMASNGLQFGSQLMRWNFGSDVKIVCVDTPFPTAYAYTPYVFANVNTRSKNISEIGRINQALIGWIHFVSATGFRYCVSESFFADRNLLSEFSPSFDWMAALPDTFNTLAVQRQRLGVDMVFRCWFDGFYASFALSLMVDNVLTIVSHLRTSYIPDLVTISNNRTGVSTTFDNSRMRHLATLYAGNTPFMSFRIDDKTPNAGANELSALDVANLVAMRFNNVKKEYKLYVGGNTATENLIRNLMDVSFYSHKPVLNMEWGRSCVATPFRRPLNCSATTCGGEGGTIRLQRGIASPSKGIAGANCPAVTEFVVCNRAPCISSATWTQWSLSGPLAFFSLSSPAGIAVIIAVVVVVIAISAFAYYIIRQRRAKGHMVGKSIGKATISA